MFIKPQSSDLSALKSKWSIDYSVGDMWVENDIPLPQQSEPFQVNILLFFTCLQNHLNLIVNFQTKLLSNMETIPQVSH